MTDTTARITDADRRLAARARELAAAHDTAALRAVTGAKPETDQVMVYADALGTAQYLLGELAAVVERLDGHAAEQATEPPLLTSLDSEDWNE